MKEEKRKCIRTKGLQLDFAFLYFAFQDSRLVVVVGGIFPRIFLFCSYSPSLPLYALIYFFLLFSDDTRHMPC